MNKAKACLNSELETRIRFETLISDISARFVREPSDTVDCEIELALRQILDFFEVDRCGMLGVREDKKIVWVTHICCKEGVEDVSKDINLAQMFPWSYEMLIAKRVPAKFERLEGLPPEAEQDRLSWIAMGVKSNLTIPLFCANGVRYLLTIQSLSNEHRWPKEFIPRLNLLGEIFVNALERRDKDHLISESRSRLNMAADSAGAGFWTLDITTGLFWLTDKTRELFGFPSDRDIYFDYFLDVVHPDDREKIHQTIAQTLDTKEKTYIQYRIIRPDGSIRWMASRGCADLGNGEKTNRLMGVSIDITERKQLQDKVETAAEQWQTTFDTIQDPIIVLDCEFRIVRINRAAESFFGSSSGQAVTGHCYDVIYGVDKPIMDCPVRKALDEKQHQESEIYLDRKNIWLQVSADPIINEKGELVGCINVFKDITERKYNEMKLLDSRETLRLFTNRLLTIQEEERRRLARELHDDFTQRLAVLAMELSNLEVSAKSAKREFEPKLVQVRDQIIRLSTDIHDISRQLHPSIIDDLGLGRAIQSECINFTRREGIKINYKLVDIPQAISRDISVCLFRITQEALRNIQKHANVKEAEVCLIGKGSRLTLMISDFGAGFDTKTARKTHGLGLFSMEERVQLINGVFSVDSKKGCGTQIKVVVALRESEDEQNKNIAGR